MSAIYKGTFPHFPKRDDSENVWVKWTTYRDNGGRPMLRLGIGSYPISDAAAIAREIASLVCVHCGGLQPVSGTCQCENDE